MVDTLPLALISVCAFHTIVALSILSNILQYMLVILALMMHSVKK